MDKVYYHGSNYKFTTFDKSKIRENKLGLCFNFTDDYSMAYQYGDNILKVHLDLNNPITEDDLDRVLTYEEDCLLCDTMGFPKIDKERFEQEKGRYSETIGSLYKVFKMKPKFIQFLQKLGYDGVSFPEDHHYGVFEPEQIHIIQNEELNDNFYKWFGESKMVNKDGSPKVFYHVTSSDFNEFKPTMWNRKQGFVPDEENGRRQYYFTQHKDWANNFGKQEFTRKQKQNQKTLEVYLKVENPLVIYSTQKHDLDWWKEYFEKHNIHFTDEELNKMSRHGYDAYGGEEKGRVKIPHVTWEVIFNDTDLVYKRLKEAGYDGLIIGDTKRDSRYSSSVIVFDSNQIKSVNNTKFSNSNNIYEKFEEIERNVYATNSGYDIINRMKNKPQAYRMIWDNNIKYYFIGDAFDYIHQDILEHAYYNGFYPDMLSANECDDYMNTNMETNNMVLFAFDPEGGGLMDTEKSSDGYTRKYVYNFGTIYAHEFTPFEKCPLYDLLGEPLKKENIFESLIKIKGTKMSIDDLNKFLDEVEFDEDMGALGAAPCPAACGPVTATGCTVNGIPVGGKSVKKKKNKKNEEIEVKHEGILEVPEGKNVEDLPIKHFQNLINKNGYESIIKALTNLEVWNKNKNKTLSSWAAGMIQKLQKKNEAVESLIKPYEPKEKDKYFATEVKEVTPEEMIEEVEETFDPANILVTTVKSNRETVRVSVRYDQPGYGMLHILKLEYLDMDGETVLDETIEEDLTTQDCVDELAFIFSTHDAIDGEMYENIVDSELEDYIHSLLNEDFNEAYERITDLIAKQLDKMNFEFANTEDIIYKKEGDYKYLFKFDNEIGIIKIKVQKDDNVLVEKEWQIDEEEDVEPIFKEIEDIYSKYGL